MPDEKKATRPEISFLPPLKLVLSFFDRDSKARDPQGKSADEKRETNEKTVARLIEKLSEKDA